MSKETIEVAYVGLANKDNREVTKEEVEELGRSWLVKDGENSKRATELTELDKARLFGEIQEEEGEVTVELGHGDNVDPASDELLEINNPDSPTAKKWLSEEERKKIREAELSESESSEPSPDNSYKSMRETIKDEFNAKVRREKRKQEEEEIRRNVRKYSEAGELKDKSLSELSAQEWAELQEKDQTPEEEIEEEVQSILEETREREKQSELSEIRNNDLEDKVVDQFSQAAKSNGYEEFAEELELEEKHGIEGTDITHLSNGRVKIRTINPELKKEIKKDKRTTVLEQKDDLMVAKGEKGAI